MSSYGGVQSTVRRRIENYKCVNTTGAPPLRKQSFLATLAAPEIGAILCAPGTLPTHPFPPLPNQERWDRDTMFQLCIRQLHRRSFYQYVLVQRIETRSEQFVKFKNSLISPTYDPNKFLKVFLKEKSLIFGQLRPAPKRQKKRNLQFFLRDRLEFNPISPTVATKTENSNQNCENISPQSRKIRKNRIFHKSFLSSFFQFLMFFDGKLQDKITTNAKLTKTTVGKQRKYF